LQITILWSGLVCQLARLCALITIAWMNTKATKAGRPCRVPTAGRTDDFIKVRVTPGERQAWLDAAESAGLNLSSWLRGVLNRAAKRSGK
jgi:hypothetical protein